MYLRLIFICIFVAISYQSLRYTQQSADIKISPSVRGSREFKLHRAHWRALLFWFVDQQHRQQQQKKREQRNSNNNNNMTTTDYPPFHESNFSLREKIKLYIYTLILYYVFFSWKCETKSRTELFWLWADTTCHVTTRQECSNWEWRICSLQYICLPSVEVLMYVEHAIIRNLSALITI